MPRSLEQEAELYDLGSLIQLQEKRKANIELFRQSIRNERSAIQQEEVVVAALESKIHRYENKIGNITEGEYELCRIDLPKLHSTREKREATVQLLKNAITEEEVAMDREEQMIRHLEKHASQK